MRVRRGIWLIAIQSSLCVAADQSAAANSTLPSKVAPPASASQALPSPAVTPKETSKAVSAPKDATAAHSLVKKSPHPLAAWEKKIEGATKIGLQTGYVSAKRGAETWRASNSARVEMGYRIYPFSSSMGLWALLQYGAFAVAPQIPRGAVTDAFIGRIEDFGLGLEMNRRFSRWLVLGQGTLGFQRAILADQEQVLDAELPPKSSAYLQAKIAAGWIFLDKKIEAGPFLAVEKGIVTVLETGLFFRASF